MTELVMLWLARSCLFAVQVKDCSLKNNRKQNIHTLSAGRHTHAHHVFAPHAESDFNCFVSVVPSEWERSLGLQFTRHICRCCISNWETQAVRKNTDTDTQREKYTDRLSLSLSNAYNAGAALLDAFLNGVKTWKCWHIWASEPDETSPLLSIKVFWLSCETTQK